MRVAIDSNISKSNGPNAIIDVQCDYRNVVLYINYHVTREYPEIAIKAFPAVTPPSLTGFLLAIVYASALLNDDENVRTVKSVYSHEFTTTRNLDGILTLLRNLPVPKFMLPLLTALFAATDDRKPNIKFVNTLACFDLAFDYGRSPPIHLYFTAHNLIATRPANIPPTDLTREWMQTELVHTPRVLCVANYLGTRIQANEYHNWFTKVNTSLFNPVTMWSNTTRPTFSEMEMFPQELGPDDFNVNPYIHLLCLDQANIDTTEAILQDISQCIVNLVP